ncbi:Branched-chain amino acid ABC transporter, amino acid-binding protein (TC 3.A.1.4.1) [Kosakonia radicincitans]|uniref:hypothetical protein n=1 Tax=Kosakonia radicincitans TaxID=283686 RepID=UPI0011829206|nr:hypothetical protein [Kosakonia radicincitans]VVT48687.1 Branched-chain amino acid ABC transporter, amino acid-binding protein (TC 3.A.1.4.1) [Kosakonia radicincitans]
MNGQPPETATGSELMADVAAIDDALTAVYLRIHTMRRRWTAGNEQTETRLAMLAVEDINDALHDASRRVARLRRCLSR